MSETDSVSDGHHTFGELYDHRRALTVALCRTLPSWRSKAHHPEDEPMFEGGYFIVGIDLPTGTITYHYKLSHWDDFAHVPELEHAPKWDGAMPDDTVARLMEYGSRRSAPFERWTTRGLESGDQIAVMDSIVVGRTYVSTTTRDGKTGLAQFTPDEFLEFADFVAREAEEVRRAKAPMPASREEPDGG